MLLYTGLRAEDNLQMNMPLWLLTSHTHELSGIAAGLTKGTYLLLHLGTKLSVITSFYPI